jgi:hypothetical protein
MKPILAKSAWAAGLALLAAMVAGCGVKSAPIPPEQARPERILDLRAESVPDGVKLTWGRPFHYEGGARMRDLAGFVILRSGNGGPLKQLIEVPVTDQGRFRVAKQFTYTDRATKIDDNYRYAVISETTDNYRGLPSNEVELRRVVPPPPPSPENFVVPTPRPLPSP